MPPTSPVFTDQDYIYQLISHTSRLACSLDHGKLSGTGGAKPRRTNQQTNNTYLGKVESMSCLCGARIYDKRLTIVPPGGLTVSASNNDFLDEGRSGRPPNEELNRGLVGR